MLRLLSEERVVLLLFSDARERAVAGANDGDRWERQDLLDIVLHSIGVAHSAAAHAAGKDAVSDNRHRPRQTAHDVGNSTWRVAPRQTALHFQPAKLPTLARSKNVRPCDRLTIPSPHFGPCFFAQSI